MFVVLLRFSETLARARTKCLLLNDEPCMIRPILIDLNLVEIKYYTFMISLDKCTGSCNVSSPKTCAKKKDINVKVFNMKRKKTMLRQWYFI